MHWWGSSVLEIQSENCRLKLLFLLHRSRRWPQRSWWNVSAIRFYEEVFPTATVHCTVWRRLTVHPCAKKLFSMLASVERIKSLILCQFEFLVLFLRFNVITNGRTDDGIKKTMLRFVKLKQVSRRSLQSFQCPSRRCALHSTFHIHDKLRSLQNVNYHVPMSESFIGEKYNYELKTSSCSSGTCLSYVFCVDRRPRIEWRQQKAAADPCFMSR